MIGQVLNAVFGESDSDPGLPTIPGGIPSLGGRFPTGTAYSIHNLTHTAKQLAASGEKSLEAGYNSQLKLWLVTVFTRGGLVCLQKGYKTKDLMEQALETKFRHQMRFRVKRWKED